MSDWNPMSEHAFPWHTERVIVVAFDCDNGDDIEIFRCRVGEHGALFPGDVGMLTILEEGWVPYAWREDDSPKRNDEALPPLWKDYLCDRTPNANT